MENKCQWGKNNNTMWKESWAVRDKISGWKWLLGQSDAYLLGVYEPAENVGPLRDRLRRWIEEAEAFLQSPDCIQKELEVCSMAAALEDTDVDDELYKSLFDKMFNHPLIETVTDGR